MLFWNNYVCCIKRGRGWRHILANHSQRVRRIMSNMVSISVLYIGKTSVGLSRVLHGPGCMSLRGVGTPQAHQTPEEGFWPEVAIPDPYGSFAA